MNVNANRMPLYIHGETAFKRAAMWPFGNRTFKEQTSRFATLAIRAKSILELVARSLLKLQGHWDAAIRMPDEVELEHRPFGRPCLVR